MDTGQKAPQKVVAKGKKRLVSWIGGSLDTTSCEAQARLAMDMMTSYQGLKEACYEETRNVEGQSHRGDKRGRFSALSVYTVPKRD